MNKFIELLDKLNIKYNDDILNKLDIYYNFLNEYNSHTNITNITDKDDVYLKHFYDSLTISKVIDLNNINSLIDIGTGAGFPGMVLKIFYPNINVTLLDSNNKKTLFLNELKDKLNIDVNIINDRAENIESKYDLVVSRSVAYLDIISELSFNLIDTNGIVILYKGSFDNELDMLNKYKDMLNIKEYKITDVSYEDNIRKLVMLKKIKNTKRLSYSNIVKRNKRLLGK